MVYFTENNNFSSRWGGGGGRPGTPIFRVHIHFLSSDISSEFKFNLSMKNIYINIKSRNENVNKDDNSIF